MKRFFDREFSVKDWSEQTKSEFYYSGIVIIECLQCGKVFKDRHGYYRDPKSLKLSGVGKHAVCFPTADLVDNLYCRDCKYSSAESSKPPYSRAENSRPLIHVPRVKSPHIHMPRIQSPHIHAPRIQNTENSKPPYSRVDSSSTYFHAP